MKKNQEKGGRVRRSGMEMLLSMLRAWRQGVVCGLAAVLAMGAFVGAFAGFSMGGASAATLPACTTSSATTSAVNLNMTSGSFGVHGNAPSNLPGPASLTGQLDPATGVISGGTLSPLIYHVSGKIATTSTETMLISQITPGAGIGSINYLGSVSYAASLRVVIAKFIYLLNFSAV